MMDIDKRNCPHDKYFVVQNKRGRCTMYCGSCGQPIQSLTKKELNAFIKAQLKQQEAKNGTY